MGPKAQAGDSITAKPALSVMKALGQAADPAVHAGPLASTTNVFSQFCLKQYTAENGMASSKGHASRPQAAPASTHVLSDLSHAVPTSAAHAPTKPPQQQPQQRNDHVDLTAMEDSPAVPQVSRRAARTAAAAKRTIDSSPEGDDGNHQGPGQTVVDPALETSIQGGQGAGATAAATASQDGVANRGKRPAAVLEEGEDEEEELVGPGKRRPAGKRRAVLQDSPDSDTAGVPAPAQTIPASITVEDSPSPAQPSVAAGVAGKGKGGGSTMLKRLVPAFEAASNFSLVMAGPGRKPAAPVTNRGVHNGSTGGVAAASNVSQPPVQPPKGDGWNNKQFTRLEGLGGSRPGGLGISMRGGSVAASGPALSGAALRTIKPQDAGARQRSAQEALQQAKRMRQADKHMDVDEESEEEGDGRAGQEAVPSLLSRVEEISEGLRAKLGEQTLGDRYAGLSPVDSSQVLVSRERVAEACGAAVGERLKGYQLVGINFLMLLSRSGTVGGAILADEMGLGKTAQTIVTLGVMQHMAMQQWKAAATAAAAVTPPRPRPRGPRPHLIICPASLLENWQRELKYWCPALRVVTYYGKERDWLREVLNRWASRADKAAEKRAKGATPSKASRAAAWLAAATAKAGAGKEAAEGAQAIELLEDDSGPGSERKSGKKSDKSDGEGEESEEDREMSEEEEEEDEDKDGLGFELSDPASGELAPFDVLLTTYSMYERDGPDNKIDRQFVSRWRWSHLVADEAHALKNRNSTRVQKLMRLARLCEHRVLLTGTPLQNDIAELLNLLRFLMPSLFPEDQEEGDSLEEELLSKQTSKDAQAQAEAVSRVRRIMSPFILRRLKSEVASQLVEKTHKLLEVDMQPGQAECYASVIANLKAEANAATSGAPARAPAASAAAAAAAPEEPEEGEEDSAVKRRRTRSTAAGSGCGTTPSRRGRSVTPGPQDNPAPAGNRAKAGAGAPTANGSVGAAGGSDPAVFEGDGAAAVSKLGGQKVNNIFTHLRKVALHPLLVRRLYSEQQVVSMAQAAVNRQLFAGQCTMDKVLAEMSTWNDHQLHEFACAHPSALGKHVLSKDAIYESAKVQALRSLLPELKARGSRVLLFSQWTQMMDVLEWFLHQEGYSFVRLDGSTQVEERLAIVDRFNDVSNGIFIFLLSTRAGGQGLNLTGADTVVLHDVDFNPQVDRQAEDRCHRLGQTRPVTVYRLVTRGTVDRNIYDIAQRKLQLDAAIIGQQGQVEGEGGEAAGEGEEGGGKKKGKAGAKGGAAVETRHMGAILAALLQNK